MIPPRNVPTPHSAPSADPPGVAHRTLPGAGGVRLHAASAGTGRLMLFLHGFPEFWYAWRHALVEFGRDHHAVALDLRGYNRSDKPPAIDAYAMANLVEDIRCVINALSPAQPAILVGHDWGGIIAWAFARAHPGMVEQLVIINAPHPAIFVRELAKSSAQKLASSYMLLFRRRWLAERCLSALRYAALRKMVFGITTRPEAFTPADRAAYLDAWSQPGALTGGLNYYRATQNITMGREPPATWQITAPTLVLWGEADPALLTGNLRGLAEFVPALTVRTQPRATHWIVLEEPAWVHAQIRAFLHTRPSGARRPV